MINKVSYLLYTLIKHKKIILHQKIMNMPVLKWKERWSNVNFHIYDNSIGFKFKKIKDNYSIKSKQPALKEVGFNTRDLKLELISMSNGVCKFFSSKEYEDKKVDHVESYAYASYRKNMPNLFNLL